MPHHKWEEIRARRSGWEAHNPADDNKRTVRVLRSIQFRQSGSWAIPAFMRIEFSPRKVGCGICRGTIQGNDEPRVTIQVPTGWHVPGKHWLSRASVRFHVDCLQAFLADGELNDHGPKHYGVCDICNRYTARRRVDDQRLCNECNTIYGEGTQRRILRSLTKLEGEYGGR